MCSACSAALRLINGCVCKLCASASASVLQAGAKARQACRQLCLLPLPLSSHTARSRAAPHALILPAGRRPPRRRRSRCCRAHTSPLCPPRCCARRRRPPGSAPRRRRTPMACLPLFRPSAGPHRTPRRRCTSSRHVDMMLPCRSRSLALCPATCCSASLTAARAALVSQSEDCQHTAVCQAPACQHASMAVLQLAAGLAHSRRTHDRTAAASIMSMWPSPAAPPRRRACRRAR